MNSTRPIPAYVLGLLGLVGRGAVAGVPWRKTARVACASQRGRACAWRSPRRGRSRWHGPWGLTGDCGAVRPVGRVRPENVECAGQCEQGRGSPGKRLDVEGRGWGRWWCDRRSMAVGLRWSRVLLKGSCSLEKVGRVRRRSIWRSMARGEELTVTRWW
jgi:hypothetical protein